MRPCYHFTLPVAALAAVISTVEKRTVTSPPNLTVPRTATYSVATPDPSLTLTVMFSKPILAAVGMKTFSVTAHQSNVNYVLTIIINDGDVGTTIDEADVEVVRCLRN